MRLRKFLLAAILGALCLNGSAQDRTSAAFAELSDSLTALSFERFGVKSRVDAWKAMKRGGEIDLYFNRTLSDYPWRDADLRWFRSRLEDLWPESCKDYSLGEIFCRSINLKDLPTPGPGKSNGKPQEYKYNFRKHKTERPFVEELHRKHPDKGLYGRNIALWQSHGLYFDGMFWSWQRTPLFRTVEDLHTQTYVLPFLIPMLENAGAYVLTPRERDSQILEVICDNDPHFSDAAESYPSSEWAENFPSPLPRRTHGGYDEKGSWTSAGEGFADARLHYSEDENPFSLGTARKAPCVAGRGKASAKWTPVFAERGNYAVYVSYKSLPGSTKSARYRVHHLGGDSEFAVDQSKGGGTWIYLGTFEFDKGSEGWVILDNGTPEGHEGGSVVSADAVRFGGGIGKIARGGEGAYSGETVSGMPSYTEGALYWMQYAGAPKSLWRKWDGDYTRDFAGRGAWVKWMKDELDIPVDLSFAFHTDAGSTPNDSIVGTLAIYTLLEEGSRKFKNGQDRMASRFLADCIQTEVSSSLRRDYDSLWRRRQLWDRSYSESRTTDVPGMILELLSHQNFADMRYSLDPQFRFDVSRSVYKGMLKFLSSYYGTQYVVQPLPVKDFAAIIVEDGKVRLNWKGVSDPDEPSASPKSYTVYTRVDGGGWDDGFDTAASTAVLPFEAGHIYSYKVVARNAGGCSFPSEILSVGQARESKGKVLVINNFTRVSGPSFFDTPDYAGFDDALDSGVPWGTELGFIGEDYEHRRSSVYSGNNAPGFGGSDYYFAGRSYAGNSFDYPYRHGKTLLGLGYTFSSASSGSLSDSLAAGLSGYAALDVICGKQVSTIVGSGLQGVKFSVYPASLRNFIKGAAAKGCNIIVSGADIATDGWDTVYPIKDEGFAAYQKEVREFVRNCFGIRWISSRASRDGVLVPMSGEIKPMKFFNRKNSESYCVENPDGIRQADSNGKLVLKYRSSNVGAGVFYKGNGYKAASYGFPLESLKSDEDLQRVLRDAFAFFGQQ